MRRRFLISVFALSLVAGNSPLAQAAEGVDFARDIQPLLAKRCFHCHGPDKAEAGLRLNRRDDALAELESGERAVVPGRPDDSALLARVSSSNEDQRMPPEGKPLSEEQQELLKRWIAAGAEWREPWALQPLVRPEVPAVDHADRVRNPIDKFILQKLAARGLKPPAPASKAALVRRVFYDLTGLPPTPAEVEAFLTDPSDDAYERLVDRLLASPRYGEQWGRHWLDVVRYADTNSFERDGPKPHSWRYRDYVIRSLNDDKPYDQFLREQLAGDELAEVTPDTLIATGFYRLGMFDDEPADRDQAQADQMDDLVTTTGQALLGLTINCARCHDHKIDPIPQRDYYRLVAFFQGIRPMASNGENIEAPIFSTPESAQAFHSRAKDIEKQRDLVQADITRFEKEFAELYRKRGVDVAAADLDDLEFRFYRDTWQRLPDFAALKPETVGRVPSRLFDLSLATRDTAFGFVFQGFLKVPADGEYTFSLDSDDGSRLRIDDRVIVDYDGIHGEGDPRETKVQLTAGRRPIQLEYFQNHHGFGLEVRWAGPGFTSRSLSAGPRPTVGQQPVAELIRSQGNELLGKSETERYQQLVKRLEELKKPDPGNERALVVKEYGPVPPDTFLLERGNVHTPGGKVEPGFPAVLGSGRASIATAPPDAASSGRRRVLADWITSRDNRLTARVITNRIWQHHFGRGIVRSTNNFGGLGTPPTHPELLDWLAVELIEGGWRFKSLHKLILLSNTYRMASEPSSAALTQDPANDNFSRFDPRRLTAEELRDSILAVNGQLNLNMYGPGIFPEIGPEVLAGQSQPGNGWGKSSLEEQNRRSVYIHVKRSLITPLLADFDFPETDSSCEARFATTQSTQALAMLNSKFLNDQARLLARRLEREAGNDPAAQAALALRLALGRAPQAGEIETGGQMMAALEQRHGLSRAAALEKYCLFVLNLNEFVYLD